MPIPDATAVAPDFAGLAHDLGTAWNAPGVTMRTPQRLLRALVTDIIADVYEATREVVLTIHWRGGQHLDCTPCQLGAQGGTVFMLTVRPRRLAKG
jgi:hypothetical protein